MTRGKEAAGRLADRKSSSGFCCYPLSLSHYEREELCLCTPLVLVFGFVSVVTNTGGNKCV